MSPFCIVLFGSRYSALFRILMSSNSCHGCRRVARTRVLDIWFQTRDRYITEAPRLVMFHHAWSSPCRSLPLTGLDTLATDEFAWCPLHSATPFPCLFLNSTPPIQYITTVAIPAKSPLDLLAPTGLLVQPVTTQPQTNTGVTGFHLRALHGDEPVEVLIQGCRFTGAAVLAKSPT